jgi:murein DD-endopeptidase MepM/ murein hydrolase activator NlpD
MGIDAAKPSTMDMTAVRPPRVPDTLAMPPLVRGTLTSGETALGILTKAGLPTTQGLSLQRAIRNTYDLRQLRSGHRYTIQLTPTGDLARFTYEISPDQQLVVLPQRETFIAEIEPIPYHSSERTIAGRIEESLYVALTSQGESPRLVHDFVDIFSWKLDVAARTQPGDTFRILVADRARDGQPPRYHRILAAEFVNQGTVWQAVYYKHEHGGEYYRPDGTSLRGMFLRSPLRYTRISSHYSRRRLHPILKRYRPHWGIDYAAPSGTPVYSIGDGVVKWVGRKGQNGKMVKIKHNQVYTSYYLHLSRYAKGVKRGVEVGQGQLIGYVGATGLATGPHLDFRLSKRGRYINPLTHDSITAPPIPDKELPVFRTHAATQLAKLQQTSSHQVASSENGQKTRP